MMAEDRIRRADQQGCALRRLPRGYFGRTGSQQPILLTEFEQVFLVDILSV
jgi:hypothetical protein